MTIAGRRIVRFKVSEVLRRAMKLGVDTGSED
jgi:hypothetical protein